MADLQSMHDNALTYGDAIGGIGGDPSGSHPNDLLEFWDSTVDDMSIIYSSAGETGDANAIMVDPDVTLSSGTDTYYSKSFGCANLPKSTTFRVGNSLDADIDIEWHYYNAALDGFDDAGNPTVGTWTKIVGAANVTASNVLAPETAGEEDAIYLGSKVRVHLVLDADTTGELSAATINAAIDVVNSSTTAVMFPVDKQAKYNVGLAPGDFGGIGADPS